MHLAPRPARWSGLALTLALLLGCAAVPPAPQAGALQGLWCNPKEDGPGCWAWDQFGPGDRLFMCGQTEPGARPFRALARVSWAGPRMCYEVLEAQGDFWLPPGGRYCTEITEVGPRHHRYRDLDSGAVFTLVRTALAEPPCPGLR